MPTRVCTASDDAPPPLHKNSHACDTSGICYSSVKEVVYHIIQGYNNLATRLSVLITNLLAQTHVYMLQRPRLNFNILPLQYFAMHSINFNIYSLISRVNKCPLLFCYEYSVDSKVLLKILVFN